METRQTKRRRKAKDAQEDLIVPNSSPLYFDLLPDDALNLTVKHLSYLPHSERWQNYLDDDIAFQTLRCGGAITKTARKLFMELTFLDPPQVNSDEYFLPRPTRTGIAAYNVTTFNNLLLAQAPRLEALAFQVHESLGFSNGGVFEFCSALRVLVVHDQSIWRDCEPTSLDPVLSKCGEVLRELQIEGNTFLHPAFAASIMNNCKALELLYLGARLCSESLLPFWEKLGPKLRRLRAFPPRITGAKRSNLGMQPELASIAHTCKKLEDVEILRYGKHDPTGPFFMALGSRLRVARFVNKGSCPAPNDLERMLGACPNVKVYATITKNVEESLRVLGSKLCALNLRHSHFEESHEFSAIVSQLWNLEELELILHKYSGNMLEQFFAIPKPILRKLVTNRMFFGGGNETNLLQLVSNATTSLTDVCIGVTSIPKLTDCGELLRLNKKLSKFFIEMKHRGWNEPRLDRETEEERIMNLVLGLRPFGNITEFKVSNTGNVRGRYLPRVYQARTTLRFSNLSVIVFGRHYLPRYPSIVE